MKGSPGRRERRKIQKQALTKNFGNQDKDFYKKVQRKRKIKRKGGQ